MHENGYSSIFCISTLLRETSPACKALHLFQVWFLKIVAQFFPSSLPEAESCPIPYVDKASFCAHARANKLARTRARKHTGLDSPRLRLWLRLHRHYQQWRPLQRPRPPRTPGIHVLFMSVRVCILNTSEPLEHYLSSRCTFGRSSKTWWGSRSDCTFRHEVCVLGR